MIPSLGRTVHYVLPETARHKGQHRAARISQVWSDKGRDATEETAVALAVDLDPINDDYQSGVPMMFVPHSTQDPHGKQLGSWHEPERVDTPEMQKKREEKAAARRREEPVPA